MRRLAMVGLVVLAAQAAFGDMVITEWMYSGTDGEFIEFTNVGSDPVDMTGWSYDDDSRTPGTVSLSAYGVVAAGESVLLTEVDATAFATAWGLSGVGVIGGNAANLGRNDEINLYDAANNLIDRLTYGDQNYPGTVRTQNASCNIPASDYAPQVVQAGWVLAAVGDAYGSWASASNDIASPGTVIPEPATAAVVLLGGLLVRGRRG